MAIQLGRETRLGTAYNAVKLLTITRQQENNFCSFRLAKLSGPLNAMICNYDNPYQLIEWQASKASIKG